MPLKAAPEDQALLLELQAIDTRLQQLGHRIANLPEAQTLAGLAAERDELVRTEIEQTGALEDAQAELSRVEADAEVVAARIARDTERLRSTSSMKDVQALEQELEALAKRRSDLDDIQLAVMETVEEREHALAGTRARLAELAERVAAAEQARDAALGDLEAQRRQATADREALVARIPAELVALYERQRERYGVGASRLQGGVTSATGVMLTASDLDAIRSAAPDDVLLCPDSNAILVRTAESGL